MRDYKKAVLGMTLALSMVVTGSYYFRWNYGKCCSYSQAKKQRLNCLPAS